MSSQYRKSVLITGCSAGGIGEALAEEFHSRGLRVFATARNVSSVQSLKTRWPDIEILELDVTNPDSILSAKSRITELTSGRLDILVNNAGVSYPYAAADMSMDKVKEVFNVNLFAAMAMLGSLAGVMPVPFGAAYNASKAALHSYGDTLRVELAPFGIKVTTFVLGNVKTNLSKPWHVLPDNSIYQPIKQEYQSRRIDNFQASAVPREPIARDIVNEALKSSPRAWVWGGANAWITWFINTFFGRRGFDALLSKMFGLKKLAELQSQSKKNV